MALSGPEQAISFYRTKLGISWRQLLEDLFDMCQGKLTGELPDRFYSLFIGRGNYGVPSAPKDVRETLRQAWWVEREDLKQHLLYIILRDRIYYKGDDVFMVLARHMRDYLIKEQRVFARQTRWEDAYKISYLNNHDTLEDIPPSIIFDVSSEVLADLTLFERYFAYLNNFLGLSRQQLTAILLEHPRQINRFKTRLQQKLEDLSCQSTTPKTKLT